MVGEIWFLCTKVVIVLICRPAFLRFNVLKLIFVFYIDIIKSVHRYSILKVANGSTNEQIGNSLQTDH